ncbi:MAG: carbohydrate binding domain-containing protein [Patescibacteria group bacterium]
MSTTGLFDDKNNRSICKIERTVARRKWFAIIALLCVTMSFAVVPFLHIPYVNAQAVVVDVAQEKKTILDTIWRVIDKALKTVVAVAYKSGLQYFLNKVAYDYASYLGSGGQGQKPAFITQGWKKYLDDAKDEALGIFLTTGVDVAIDELTKPEMPEECAKYCCQGKWKIDEQGNAGCSELQGDGLCLSFGSSEYEAVAEKLMQCQIKNKKTQAARDKSNASKAKLRGTLHQKLTLCSPISVDIEAKIKLTAREILAPSKPLCTFSQIRKNLPRTSVRINGLDIFRTDYKQLKLKDLPKFATYFNPAENDIGAVLSIVAEGYSAQTKARTAKELERKEGEGFNPVKDLITGELKTPTTLVSESTREALTKKPYGPMLLFTGDAVADAFKVFTNTLVSKLFKRITSGGFNPATDRSLSSYGPSSGLIGFTAGAQLAFAEIMKTDFTTDSAVDLLSELSSNTTGPENRVISELFRLAIDVNPHLSVREAVEPVGTGGCPKCQGLLSRNLTFGFEQGGSQPDWQSGIPYRSIVILRKYRIVPVGWELAALYIKNFAQTRVTLGELLDAHDKCGQNGGLLSPYCRLVDPNWILKAPLTKCVREGPGEADLKVTLATLPICDTDTNGNGTILCPPDIASPAISRENVCTNQRSCIVEGGATGCLAYGYCATEKQVWSLGESCPAQYASCLELKKAGSDQTVSFLLNTTDAQGCTRVASEGCRRYARRRDAGGWVDSVAAPDNYFLNQSALTMAEAACKEPNAVGCKDYIRLRHRDEAKHLLTAQEYADVLQDVTSDPPTDTYRGTPTPPQQGAPREAESVYLNNTAQSCMGPVGQEGMYAGCALYTPLDPTELQIGIPAKPTMATIAPATNTVSNWNDECPAECVGYKKYEQMQTNFEAGIPITNMPPAPVAQFIPATAHSCPAQDAGCDEFTNLDKVAQGGEGKEYYTELKQCELPGSGEATYYTWEGSDTVGFQLKVWTLIPSGGATSEPAVTGAKIVDSLRSPDGINCQNDFNSLNPDLDCREFIDSNLTYYYRYFSKVIIASDDCHPLRRTLPDAGGWCAQHRGEADANGHCVYQAIPYYSATCAPSSAGCREYRRGDGSNVQQLFSDTFESGSYEPWSPAAGTALSISNEAAVLNNHSLKMAGGTAGSASAYRPGFSVETGRLYNVKFWARADSASTISASLVDSTGQAAVATPASYADSVTTSWKSYTLGPFTATSASPAQVRITVGSTTYIDNVIVQTAQVYAIKDSWYTPETCDQNSQVPPITTVAGAQLNCAAYRQGGTEKTYYFKKFSTLCPERFVGCEALIDTQNSSNPAEQTFYNSNATDRFNSPASIVTVPADALAYLIPSQDAACSANQAGCTLLGQASVAFWNSANGVATSTYADTIVMVDPDTFSDEIGKIGEITSLCTLPEEYCATLTRTDNSSFPSFKDPTGYTCEYETEGTVTTWYQLGTSTPCPTVTSVCSNAPYRSCTNATTQCPEGGTCRPLGFCIGGRAVRDAISGGVTYPKVKNRCLSDADCMDFSRPGSQGLCSNAVARCKPQVSTCTEYQDPRLPEGCSRALVYGQKACSEDGAFACTTDAQCSTTATPPGPGGTCSVSACDFLYVPKDKIQSQLSDCKGELDPEAGCVGLHETGGGPDTIITAKHCSNSPVGNPRPCITDNDCDTGGTCGYQQ